MGVGVGGGLVAGQGRGARAIARHHLLAKGHLLLPNRALERVHRRLKLLSRFDALDLLLQVADRLLDLLLLLHTRLVGGLVLAELRFCTLLLLHQLLLHLAEHGRLAVDRRAQLREGI